ncbi:MAG: hypothetical protein DIU71_00425 [Proteobacteria bacterium]|nr:MAG: hypothetical protein DIU71_00425 [Pseudomonadota bacterium]
MAPDSDFQPQQRLHPLSWLFAFLAFARQLILPAIAFLVFGTRPDGMHWGAWLLAPVLLVALWQQWFYRYGFGPRGLVIRRGLLFRSLRQIDYERIENIDTERGPLHRMFGVAQVKIHTSTGGRPEALIRVLGLAAVEEMRTRVFGAGAPAAREQAAAQHGTRLIHLAPGELVRYGLIDNRGLVVVVAAGGVLHELGLFERLSAQVHGALESSAFVELVALGPGLQVALAAAAVLGGLIVTRILSIALALITLYDFTLEARGGDLRVRHGLLTRVALTLRTSRIQAVHRTESLLHRLLGRTSLRVDLAGDAQVGNPQNAQATVRWLAPVCTPGTAPALIAAALPEVNLDVQPDWQPLAPRAGARVFKVTTAIWLLVASAPAFWLLHEWTPLALLAGVPGAWLHAHLYVKHTRWALTPDAVMFRRGWLTRALTIVPRDCVQSVRVTRSPFDRRRRMARIIIDTAGGTGGKAAIQIRHLDARAARALAAALYRTATPLRASRAARERDGSPQALWS